MTDMDELLPLTHPAADAAGPGADDAATSMAYRNDPEVGPLPGLAAAVHDADGLVRVIEHRPGSAGPRPASGSRSAVDHDGELVGDLAVGLDGTGKLAMIGYTLRADRHGRGFATEAVGALIDGMFASGIHRVAATLDPENIVVRDAPRAPRLPVRGSRDRGGVRARGLGR